MLRTDIFNSQLVITKYIQCRYDEYNDIKQYMMTLLKFDTGINIISNGHNLNVNDAAILGFEKAMYLRPVKTQL